MNFQTRRSLLKTASLATAAAAFHANAQTTAPATTPEPYQLFPAARLAEAIHTTQAKPGNANLATADKLPFSITITTEVKKAAAEFEFHENRDHIFQILEGATTYELGGTPVNARNTKPGEYLAPSSTGFTTVKLAKGDMLTIPRGTPHRRVTETSVTFTLISIEGNKKA